MKFDTLVDLLRYALCGVAIRWCEGLVDTERAAARRDPPITIGAAQRRIDRELLHPTAHQSTEIGRIVVETAVIWKFKIQDSKCKIIPLLLFVLFAGLFLCYQLVTHTCGLGRSPVGRAHEYVSKSKILPVL